MIVFVKKYTDDVSIVSVVILVLREPEIIVWSETFRKQNYARVICLYALVL